MYSNITTSLEHLSSELIRAFVKFSLDAAENSSNKKESTMYAIKLINSYINKAEGEKYIKLDKNLYKAEPLVDIKIDVKQHNVHVITICKTLTIFHLKNAISNGLKVPLSQIKVKHKASNTLLVEKDCDKLIIDKILGTTEIPFIVEIIKSKKNPFNVSNALSNNKELKERLFKLMKQDDDFAEEIWKLMKGLNENLLKYKTPSNEDLTIGKIAETWDKLMSPDKDLHILLWNIHTMKRLMVEKQFSETPTENYMQSCLKKGIFVYLTEKYKQLALTLKEKSFIRARLVKYILKILYNAINQY